MLRVNLTKTINYKKGIFPKFVCPDISGDILLMDRKVILITGGSSGIGFETAGTLASMGHVVYAAARRTDRMEALRQHGVSILPLDVTDDASMQRCVSTILEEQGRIDILVNNAGYGYFGAVENVSMEEARRQLEVNVFGLARLTQLVLPAMRAQGSGRIINVSSVAGKVVLSYGGWYHVSKFAVEALSDSLRMETKPFGIDVVLIEPSGIKTDWGIIAADNLSECSAGTVYQKTAENEARIMRFAYSSDFLSGPSAVRKAICRAVTARRPRLRYRPGRGACLLLAAHALLPARWWDALNLAAVSH